MTEYLYAYADGDDHCVSFETADPAAAAAAYIEESESESGQVLVIVGDGLQEYRVVGPDAEFVEGVRWPSGWERVSVIPAVWRFNTGWGVIDVVAHPVVRTVEVRLADGTDFYNTDTIGVAYGRTTTAEAEAVLQMAAYLAFGVVRP